MTQSFLPEGSESSAVLAGLGSCCFQLSISDYRMYYTVTGIERPPGNLLYVRHTLPCGHFEAAARPPLGAQEQLSQQVQCFPSLPVEQPLPRSLFSEISHGTKYLHIFLDHSKGSTCLINHRPPCHQFPSYILSPLQSSQTTGHSLISSIDLHFWPIFLPPQNMSSKTYRSNVCPLGGFPLTTVLQGRLRKELHAKPVRFQMAPACCV